MKAGIYLLLMSSLTIAKCAPIRTDSSDSSSKPITSQAFPSSGLTCDLCKGIATILQKLMVSSKNEEDVVKTTIDLCIDLKIEDTNVCKQVVPQYKNMALTVWDEVALSPSEACGALLGDGCGSAFNPFNQKWDVPLPNVPKPPITPNQRPTASSPRNRILHLSDIHFDKDYVPGLSTDCGEPLCCRPPNEKGAGNTAAGFWGDYNCDVPLWTIEDLLQKLAQKRDEFDWVYWTGDIPAHNIWNQSRDDQTRIIKTITDVIRKYLPDKPVFPSIGNHESSPSNSFPPPYITGPNSNQWLLNAVTIEWSKWLPATALDTMIKGGYYSVKIRKGLRVISLHTNYCYRLNWWLLINSTDPGNQLHWLVKELQSAEDAGEKVHIIGHIPPGNSDCIRTWSYNFHKIVNRYESTIAGQFYGHSHSDLMQVYYDEQNTSRPVSVAMIGPSVTTYTGNNMGYRIYTIDGDHTNTTNALLDFEVYYMNVSEAKRTNQSRWIQEYVASRDYGMEYCFPADFGDLVKRFEQNDNLFQAYYRHITRLHPPTPVCDSKCKASTICAIKTSISGDHSLCDNLPDGLTMEEVHSMIQKRETC